jgi:hypothetical protein
MPCQAHLAVADRDFQQQQIAFTMGYGVAFRTYHNTVVRKKITPSIPAFTSIMVEEVASALASQIGSPQGSPPYLTDSAPN